MISGMDRDTAVGEGQVRVCHRLIEGDNLPALRLLHGRGETFDVIYLDPPYNTGGFLSYGDRRGRGGDKRSTVEHEVWASFMRPRLEVCRQLMGETSVLIMSIGDEEMPYARLLLDEVFGGANHLGTAIWDGANAVSNARFISTSHDYLLFYGRNWRELGKWREPKPQVGKLLAEAKRLTECLPHDLAEVQWRRYLKRSGAPGGVRKYGHLTEEGRPWREASLASPGTSRYQYDVVHPITGKACRKPARGWRCAESTFANLDAQGLIFYGADETTVPQRVYFLDENQTQPPPSVFASPAHRAARHIADLLGLPSSPFTFPKDHEVLARWLQLAAGGNLGARVLDPFAGSGSTIEAVAHLNADGGERRATAITLNERVPSLAQAGVDGLGDLLDEGTFFGVTLPRVRSALSGLRPDGSRWGPGSPRQCLQALELRGEELVEI